jgi:hypothetical protein
VGYGGMGRDGSCWDCIAMVVGIDVQLFGDLQYIRLKWGMDIIENFGVIKS